jgi:hypothetical protein
MCDHSGYGRRQSRADASSTTLLLTLCLATSVRDQFISHTGPFGHILAQDRASTFKRPRHRSDPELAIINVDENGIACSDPQFPAHRCRYDELAAVDNL